MNNRPKIKIVTENKINQAYIDAGGVVDLIIEHQGQKPILLEIDKNSTDLTKALVAMPDGSIQLTVQPLILKFTNTYWDIERIAEENTIVLNPSYEEGILKIDAYNKVDGKKEPLENFSCSIRFNAYDRKGSGYTFKITNNTIDESKISEALKNKLKISNTEEGVVGINLDGLDINDFDLILQPLEGVVFDELGGFTKGKLEVTK